MKVLTRLLAIWMCVASLAIAISACGDATSDRGFDLRVRIREAQLVRAAFPSDSSGPALPFVDVRVQNVAAGDTDNVILGRAAASTFAINIGVEGDAGYWVFPVGLPDETTPGDLQFKALLDYARALPAGPLRVFIQAVNGDGVPGARYVVNMQVRSLVPTAPLVFSLEWDAQMDVDLVVIDPSGVSINAKNINSVKPPPIGEPSPPADAWKAGGILDQDSNANCVIDGRRIENIAWTQTPPKGKYQVFVALPATCGVSRSSFRLNVLQNGQRLQSYSDVIYASDARSQPLEPGLSPGLLVTEFVLQ